MRTRRVRIGAQRTSRADDIISSFALAVVLAPLVASAQPSVVRSETTVKSDPGVSIFVREVKPAGREPIGPALILVHGARVPGVASFDLPVPGGSLAADLAAAGFRVLVIDVRGYGRSTRPAAMSEPPTAHPPLVRSDEVVRDLDAVVAWAQARTGARAVALFGWATGGHWCGMYAALHPERVSHLVMLNTLYGADAPHPLIGRGSDLDDPAHPGAFRVAAVGAYRFSTAASLLAPWEANRRESPVAAAYAEAALASDPTSTTRNPPSLRAPTGALEDSFYQASGRQLWDASFIRAATLVVRGERDFWSRPEDVARLEAHLTHAARVRVVRLPNATHFVHLDRPENGRAQLLKDVLAFLQAPARELRHLPP